jgi:hypothetical protein
MQSKDAETTDERAARCLPAQRIDSVTNCLSFTCEVHTWTDAWQRPRNKIIHRDQWIIHTSFSLNLFSSSEGLKAFSTFYCVVEDDVYSGCGSSFVEPGASDISSGGVFHRVSSFHAIPRRLTTFTLTVHVHVSNHADNTRLPREGFGTALRSHNTG